MSQRYPTVPPGADPLLVVDASGASEVATLTQMTPGLRLRIERRDSVGANTVTVTAPSPLTLDGVAGGSLTLGVDTEIRLDVVDGGFESFGGGGSAAAIAAALLLADQTRQNNTYADYKSLAKNPDSIITGAVTRDSSGTATSATVTWPDGKTGTYTATTLSTAFPGAVDAYTITYGSPVTRTYTQPAITRDATTGAATNVPAIVVS